MFLFQPMKHLQQTREFARRLEFSSITFEPGVRNDVDIRKVGRYIY